MVVMFPACVAIGHPLLFLPFTLLRGHWDIKYIMTKAHEYIHVFLLLHTGFTVPLKYGLT